MTSKHGANPRWPRAVNSKGGSDQFGRDAARKMGYKGQEVREVSVAHRPVELALLREARKS